MSEADVEELVEVLRAAASALDKADLPADLRGVAFGKLLDRLLPTAKQPTASLPTVDLVDMGASEKMSGSNPPAESGWPAVADRSGVPIATWMRLAHEHDGNVELLVSKARLSASPKTATREVALLLGAVRQGLALEDFTPLDVVRAELRRYGRLSSGHFREYMDVLDDVVTVRASDRAFRLLPDGWEVLSALVERLTAPQQL